LNQLSKFESDNSSIKKAAEAIRESLQAIDDAVFNVRAIRDCIDLDEERKKIVKERINQLNNLSQKYKLTLPEIIDYQKEIQKKLEQFSSLSKKIIEAEKEIELQKQKVIEIADLISKKRKKAANLLEKEVEENLQNLAIPHAKVDIKIDKIVAEKDCIKNLVEMSVFGNDKVDFYFSANPGMQLESLKNAASGGELSRFLLTIKKIISDNLDSKVIIFDEIDTGIGGRTAEFMGNFIRSIAKNHQVICLTHLAAIASYADEHFWVEKEVSQKQTEIYFKKLNDREKKQELARMISGERSQHALNYAEEILKNKTVVKEKKEND
jgi:DNA repair protein RecN (Recombination protein N)